MTAREGNGERVSQLKLTNSFFLGFVQWWAENFRVSSENFYVRKRNKAGIKQGEKRER